MRTRNIAVAVMTAALVVFGSAITSLAAGWTTPVQLFTAMEGPAYSATFDATGHVRAAVEGQDNPGLFYVTESSQHHVVGGSHFQFESAIAHTSVSGHGVERIVWVDPNNRGALWLTRNDTGSWVSSRLWIGTAFTPSVANLGPGIAVAFRDGAHQLRYLKWTPAGGPTSPVVVSNRCCTGAPSIAIQGGLPSVAFSEANTGPSAHRLRLASRSAAGVWHTSTVDLHATSSPSFAFAVGGVPVIAYNAIASGVWYARKSGGWHLSQVFGTTFAEPAIAADSTGMIAVVAIREETPSLVGQIKFRRVDVASPATLIADSSGLTGHPNDPRIGLSGGHATVTFTSSCECAGPGFLWVSKLP